MKTRNCNVIRSRQTILLSELMRDLMLYCGALTKGYVIASLAKLKSPWRVLSGHCWQRGV